MIMAEAKAPPAQAPAPGADPAPEADKGPVVDTATLDKAQTRADLFSGKKEVKVVCIEHSLRDHITGTLFLQETPQIITDINADSASYIRRCIEAGILRLLPEEAKAEETK